MMAPHWRGYTSTARPEDLPPPPPRPTLGPFRIQVERRGRRWYAWVRGHGILEYTRTTRHRAKTREEAIAKAQADADRIAGEEAPKPDVVEYTP